MNTRLTFSVRQLVLVGFVALALLVAYLLGGRGATPAVAATSPTTGTPAATRTITLAGRGSTTAIPDELTFVVTVVHTSADTGSALASTNTTMAAVLTRLKHLGVARRDTASTDLSVQPTYRWNGSDEVIDGYRASQSVRVTVHDLAAVGKLLSAAVATGGNDTTVDNLQLAVAHPEKYQARARTSAIADARAKANAYAKATGQHLGQVLQITERSVSAPPEPTSLGDFAARTPAALDLKSVPVRSGRQPVTASITVVWQLS